MTELKLAKLPDRTPVRIGITVNPDLNRNLHAYAELYREAYGTAESVPELIPYMLQSFLDGDRGFAKARKEGTVVERSIAATPSRRGHRLRAGSADPSSIASEGE